MTYATRTRFVGLAQRSGLRNADQCYDQLAALYAEPHRAYHTLTHIDHMLGLLDNSEQHTDALELAVWFHDVIYDPRSQTNEADSAKLFEEMSKAGPAESLISETTRLIIATDHRTPIPSSAAEKLIRDIDLSILGTTPENYHNYSQQIRFEYKHVEEQDYRNGRRKVLEHFLTKPIYLTGNFRILEQAARLNLTTELQQLSSTKQDL